MLRMEHANPKHEQNAERDNGVEQCAATGSGTGSSLTDSDSSKDGGLASTTQEQVRFSAGVAWKKNVHNVHLYDPYRSLIHVLVLVCCILCRGCLRKLALSLAGAPSRLSCCTRCLQRVTRETTRQRE